MAKDQKDKKAARIQEALNLFFAEHGQAIDDAIAEYVDTVGAKEALKFALTNQITFLKGGRYKSEWIVSSVDDPKYKPASTLVS